VLTFVTLDQLEAERMAETLAPMGGEGWIGTDFNKVMAQVRRKSDEGCHQRWRHEFLYDRPIPHLRYFDWQAGARVDIDSGQLAAWAAIGMQGLLRTSSILRTLYVRDGGCVAKNLRLVRFVLTHA